MISCHILGIGVHLVQLEKVIYSRFRVASEHSWNAQRWVQAHNGRQFTWLLLYSAWESIIVTHVPDADAAGQSSTHKGNMGIN